MTAPIEKHYTTAQAADLIGMSSAGLRNARCANRGPVWIRTTDGRVLYPASEIAAYLSGKRKAA